VQEISPKHLTGRHVKTYKVLEKGYFSGEEILQFVAPIEVKFGWGVF